MNFYKNNYYQSDEFRNLNELILRIRLLILIKINFLF